MPRSSWKGYLKLSLVSVPVRGYTANIAASEIRLHQLHSECHSRIKYQKTCPIHGEVPKEEIVSGYEYAKGEYVVIEPEEIARLRGERERAVTIDAVVSQHTIDPVYFTDKSYYLVPDGAIGQKPFALIQKCLADEELQAVGRVVLFGREELVLVRPVEHVLAMTALKYESEVAHADILDEEVEKAELNRDELKLTKKLLDAFEKPKFSIAAYKDHYVEELRKIIEAKVEGKELVTPPAAEEPRVINLMDALKKSVAAAKKGGEEPRGRKSKAVAANGRHQGHAGKRRKKSA
ncbi:MAG TPA: Ku protein [Pirellulaceae bacterium]|jgi:DNA end-binding protein Ku